MMLKGKALQERARELSIPGRSKMSADELRKAVAVAEAGGVINDAYGNAESIEEQYETTKPVGHAAPLTYHDRLAVYLETNNTEHTFNDDPPKLTHRQRRRLRKKARKNGGA